MMDCNCSQRCAIPPRAQMPTPPCMNTNCGCRPAAVPLPSQTRPAQTAPLQPSQAPQPMPLQPVQPVQTMRPVPPAQTLMPEGAAGLPVSHMPIAMAYVPWQQWRQTYPMDQGLSRGTIFPELDLPFLMGRCR